MRLICPNCSATYEVPDGIVPESGGHVQCTACHTRWYTRGARAAALLSEDKIIERLETWPPRSPSARPTELREPETAPPAGPRVTPPPSEPAAAPSEEPEFAWETATAPAPEPLPILDGKATAASADQATEAPIGATYHDHVGPTDRARDAAPPRQAPRLDLNRAVGAAPARVAPQSRFWRGLAAGLLIASLPVAAYVYAVPLSVRLPAAAAALVTHAAWVEAARERIEARLGPLRARLTGS